MQGLEVNLPGGLYKNGRLVNKVVFKPVTGKVEQTLIEFRADDSRPDYVTHLLSTAINTVGEYKADKNIISELCVADRQYLLLKLAEILNGDLMWLKICCQQCHEYFDVDIKRSELPIKFAGSDFPEVTIKLRNDTLVARVPNGNDQHKIQKLTDDQAMTELIYLCILSVNNMDVSRQYVEDLTDSEINLIDNTLDEVAPAVCDRILVNCPECGHEQQVIMDHANLTGIDEHVFYDEIHTLASRYHWSENSILELPKERRRLYLELINRSSGYTV